MRKSKSPFVQELIMWHPSSLSVQTYGVYTLLSLHHEAIFAYIKTLQDQRVVVVMNFSKEATTYTDLPAIGKVIDTIRNYPTAGDGGIVGTSPLHLRAWEAVVFATSP